VITARSDAVGSMLRPAGLVAARERLARGELDRAAFKRIEDAAVDAAIACQEAAGMAVVTDGEQRRLSFQAQMVEAVDGFGAWDLDAFLWGDWQSDALGERRIERPALAVESRLTRRRFLSVEEFVYARARTTRIVKVTLPSPSLFSQFWHPVRSRAAYRTLESLVEDVAEVLRAEVEELVRLGATYIQIDAPHYPMFVDPAYRAVYEERGWPAEDWLAFGLSYDNYVMSGHPDGVTFAFHLCRGNQMSRWLLGLVTTKSGRRETVDELAGRIAEAAREVPLERLALSSQCGFATSLLGNELTPDDQQAKLEAIAATAERVWGEAAVRA